MIRLRGGFPSADSIARQVLRRAAYQLTNAGGNLIGRCGAGCHPATLDTGPLAKSYPDGISPRSSSNHFQFARSIGLFGSGTGDSEQISLKRKNKPDWKKCWPMLSAHSCFQTLLEVYLFAIVIICKQPAYSWLPFLPFFPLV